MAKQLPIRVSVQEILDYPFNFLTNEIRIVAVLRGSIQMKFVAGTVALNANDLEIININEPVGLWGEQGNVAMIISIDGNFARSVSPRIDKMNLNCSMNYLFPSRVDKKEKMRLSAYITQIVDLLLLQEGNHSAIEEKTTELLQFLVNNFNSITNVLKHASNAETQLSRFQNINDYIKDNMEHKLTLGDVASQEYLSMQYLANEFKKKYGHTFNEILSYYRVVHSVRLLLDTQLTIMEISEKSGFSATRYYYKYFKKYLLISPKEFRRQNLKNAAVPGNFRELDLESVWRYHAKHTEAFRQQPNYRARQRVLLINPNTTNAVTERLERVARDAFSDNILMTALSIPFGPDVLRTDLDDRLSEIAVLELLLEHKGNYDGAIIACFSDIGIKIAKKMLGVPVISIAEAAYYSAGLLGERFAVITSGGDQERRLIHAAINRCGMESCCTSVRSLHANYSQIDETIQERLEGLVEECYQTEGADTIVLACTSLAGLGEKISAKYSMPVIDGVTQAAVFIEGMLSPAWRKLVYGPSRPAIRTVLTGHLSIKNIERAYQEDAR